MNELRIRCHQLNTIVGQFRKNADKILHSLEQAERDGIDLLVLPELTVCGYPPLDLLEHKTFIDACLNVTHEIIQASGSTALLFGSIWKNPSQHGRALFNAAILAEHGKLQAVRFKTLLPTYDIFDELRYFEPASENTPVLWRKTLLGVTICEDIWTLDTQNTYVNYAIDPVHTLVEQGAQLLINLSASPYTRNKAEIRRELLSKQAKKHQVPIAYCNLCGSNTEVIFDGDSMFVNPSGELIGQASLFDEGWVDAHYDRQTLTPLKQTINGIPRTEERTFRALMSGIRDYFTKSGIPPKVVLGLSGGIDSALVAVLAAEAIGPDQVVGLLMPSPYSSQGSIDDSLTLANNLGISTHTLAIHEIFGSFQQTLEPAFVGLSSDVTEENLQSRIRGTLLMAYSNKFGHLLLNTGNKSELAVGYCTLYGDMNGALSVLADLYKTEVYLLSQWLNSHYFMREVIPTRILEKAPSAELSPGQKDSDSLPEYDVLDSILIKLIEQQHSVHEIVEIGYEAQIVHKVYSLLMKSEFKRKQAPPGLRLSAKAFGMGRRIPLVHGWNETDLNH